VFGSFHRGVAALSALTVLTGLCLLTLPATANAEIIDGTRFYVPTPNRDAVRQVIRLKRHGRHADAARISAMIQTPTGVWVETGSTKGTERQVRRVTRHAAAKRTVPLLVLYNIPFRDCAQYSAGGATSVAEYKAWVDAVARGIGKRHAANALEPDE